MTTEQPGRRVSSTPQIARRALVSTVLVGLAAVLLGAVLAGPAAAAGAGIGVAIVAVSFAVGAAVLVSVTRLAPAVSLLVALLTYTVKIVAIGVAFWYLSRSGALAGPLDAQWLGGTVIACTLAWTGTQIVVGARARQLAYDLPDERQEASVR